MASVEASSRTHDRHVRRRPFANWMKRLANLKSSHIDGTNSRGASQATSPIKSRKAGIVKNSPYMTTTPKPDYIYSDYTTAAVPLSLTTPRQSFAHSKTSQESPRPVKSRAPTLATTAETITSDTGSRSGAGTSTTVPRTEGDRDSTFSSPAPSLRSVTTTLTTLQSMGPTLNGTVHQQPLQQNPVYHTTQPASAVPPHLVPHSYLTTHHMATANNVLTDDASILTLASSSKRRRRNSLDTNASIRALAPASMFGNSRESLPLSMLSSAHPDRAGTTGDNASLRDTSSSSQHYPHPRSGSAMNVERASLISASGITAPALASERNSYVSQKPTGDGASIRSGLLGGGGGHDLHHGRNDSLGGISVTRDRHAERDRGHSQDYFREMPMVTAPTSPMPV